MNSRLREVSENVRRLAEEATFPGSLRERAEAVRDLLDLVATWPVPSAMRLDEDIRTQLPDLCNATGVAMCRMPRCAAPVGAAAKARCPIVP